MGLDAGRLRAQIERVRALAADAGAGVHACWSAAEVDILKDGSLDYSDELLAELDVVVASVHASHRFSAEGSDEAGVRGDATIPTLISSATPPAAGSAVREPNPLDMEEVVAVAVETGTVLEVSGQPERLDLSDVHARMALEAGARSRSTPTGTRCRRSTTCASV